MNLRFPNYAYYHKCSTRLSRDGTKTCPNKGRGWVLDMLRGDYQAVCKEHNWDKDIPDLNPSTMDTYIIELLKIIRSDIKPDINNIDWDNV